MEVPDGDNQKEYRWETGYEKTWEAIKEDDDGLLDSAIAEIIRKAKRKRQVEKAGQNRLGMMRHLYILLDCSDSMNVPDLKPTRFACTLKLLRLFIEEFFDQNPISQFGIIGLKGKRAEKLTELSGTPMAHFKCLEGLVKQSFTGEPSLQNGLDLAMKSLKMVPTHASREVLIIMGSLTTCDPTDIMQTIAALKAENVRCSFISLSAEMHVCRYLAQETNGTYGAVLDDAHYRDQLLSFVRPPPLAKAQENSMIRMAFPHAQEKLESQISLCMCHLNSTDEPCSKPSSAGYYCPQCLSKYCTLPVECRICGLTLVTAPHLARSYHYLFPVQPFEELDFQPTPDEPRVYCFACQKPLSTASDKHVYRCRKCAELFCIDCDILMHDTLHHCVACNVKPNCVQNALGLRVN